MLSPNLLPLQERAVFHYEQWRRFAIVAGVGLYGALVIGIVFLLPSYLPSLFQQSEFERLRALEELAFRSAATRGARTHANTVRSLLSAMHIQEGQRYDSLSAALERVLKESDGLSITLVSVSLKNDGIVSLTGQAAARDDLLEFEGRLRASRLFQNITSPLSNIIRERNISFTLQGALAKKQ